MKIEQKQIKYNYSFRSDKIKYIVIHDTGNTANGADANAHFNYFNGGNRGSSADVFIDESGALIVNDYIRFYSWHCGDGRGKYGITNSNSIGIEICINRDGNLQKSIDNTVVFVKQLMKDLNIQSKNVVRHYDASRKKCPASMSSNNWNIWINFKKQLESEDISMTQYEELKKDIMEIKKSIMDLSKEKPEPVIYNYIDQNMPSWAVPTIQKLVNKGALIGDENGLHLSEDLLRIFVINDRMGLYK